MGYIKVDEVVREVLGEEGDTLHLYPKYLGYALRGVKQLNYDVTGTPKTMFLPIQDNGDALFPPDYVDYTKIGVAGTDGNVKVLGLNERLVMANEVDSCGQEINNGAIGDTRERDTGSIGYGYWFYNYRNGQNMGAIFGHGGGNNQYGYYRIDNENNRIRTTEVKSSHILLEYVSNGVDFEGETLIHEYAKETLMAWINWKASLKRPSAPMSEKQNYERIYYNEERLLRLREFMFTPEEYMQAVRRNYKQSPKN